MMILYGIDLVPLAEELQDVYFTILSPFYTNDTAFDGLAQRIVAQLRLLMDRGPDRGYFLKPAKSLFIADNPEDKEATKRGFE